MGGFVGSKDDICLFTGDGSIFVRLNNQSVGSKRCESINVNSKFDLDKISFLDVDRVFLEWGEVSTDFVDGDGGGKGESFEDWFFIINFAEFFVDEVVAPEAELKDFASD